MAAKKTAKAAATPMTKTQLINALVDQSGEVTRKQVKQIVETLVTVGHKQLKRVGQFTVPGYAKFVVQRKPAQKARKGTNPFTGEPTVFKAKPARKIVRARPVKLIKDFIA